MSIFFGDLKVFLRVQRDHIAEVRDPETDELVDHVWAPHDEWLDLSDNVIRIEIGPGDIDGRREPA